MIRKNGQLSARITALPISFRKQLREVLGTHVEQAGSDVNADRLRFDFTHFSPMTAEEIARTEAIVNQKIEENLPVETAIMSLEEAKRPALWLCSEKNMGKKYEW